MHRTLFTLALVGLIGCGNGSSGTSPRPDATVPSDVVTRDVITTDTTDASAPAAVQVMMDFTRSAGFYTAPFPSEDLRTASGGVDMSAFPNPNHNTLISQCLGMITADGDGFPETVSSYFELTGAPDTTRLADVHGSLLPSANVFIMDVDPNSPDVGLRQAVDTHYEDDGGPFGAPHLLSVLPYQGKPLRPLTLYATVVLRSLQDPQGNTLAVSPAMTSMAAGVAPPQQYGRSLNRRSGQNGNYAMYRQGHVQGGCKAMGHSITYPLNGDGSLLTSRRAHRAVHIPRNRSISARSRSISPSAACSRASEASFAARSASFSVHSCSSIVRQSCFPSRSSAIRNRWPSSTTTSHAPSSFECTGPFPA